MTLTVGGLCAGIGGIEYGLELTGGFTTRWQAEIDPFARRVLAKHWPDAQRLEDVRHVSRDSVSRVDLITAGFPCQPHSLNGLRKSSDDERDLWGECARVIGELEPRWVLAENVSGLLTSADPAYGRDYPGAYFGRILSDLAALGYDAEWQSLRASDFGAPHQRERVFILAYPMQERLQGGAPYGPRLRTETLPEAPSWGPLPTSKVYGGTDGIPLGFHRYNRRNMALGNAVVPQVARWIGERILAAEGAA